jgi:hypothetical protein
MEPLILCPNCQFSADIPIFHCIRCRHPLLKDAAAEGKQIVLRFEGSMIRTIALFRHQMPSAVSRVEIRGPSILLMIEGEQLERPIAALFNVLRRKEELWDLE